MNGNNDLVTKITGTSTLERAKFGPGMLLRDDDLEQLNTYPRELSRLLFRSLFGCGVVCGLVVEPPEDKCDKIWIHVSSGLALDCSGDPIHVPKDAEALSFDAKCQDKELWVILCGTTRACSPRTSACPSDDEESSSTPSREKDGYEIRIVRTLPKCICACLKEPPKKSSQDSATGTPAPAKEPECPCVGPDHPCYSAHYEGKCGCDAGNDCDCCCKCVVLARLDKVNDEPWTVTHAVRRFVRPVLMRDPEVEQDRKRAAEKEKKAKKDEVDKAAADKAATDKAAADKAAVDKAAADKAATEKVAADKAAAEKVAAEKVAAEKVAADGKAQLLQQQLAKQGKEKVARGKARSSKSRSSK